VSSGSASRRFPRPVAHSPAYSVRTTGNAVVVRASVGPLPPIPKHIGGGTSSASTVHDTVRAVRRTSLDTFASFAEQSVVSKDTSHRRLWSSTHNSVVSNGSGSKHTYAHQPKSIMRFTTLAESLQSVFGQHASLHDSLDGGTFCDGNSSHGWLSSERSIDTHTTGSSSKVFRHRLHRVHHHVGFGTVQVQEYVRILGDNPSCSSGPPISYVSQAKMLLAFSNQCAHMCTSFIPPNLIQNWLGISSRRARIRY
jgi:hypothetical protein